MPTRHEGAACVLENFDVEAGLALLAAGGGAARAEGFLAAGAMVAELDAEGAEAVEGHGMVDLGG
jgi:hypothetical protein